ncbi:MAG: PQQ-dependent sugar dehydrogenase [Variovorax sp.]
MKSFVGWVFVAAALAGCGGGGGSSDGGGGGDQSFGLDSRQTPAAVQIPTGPGASTGLRAVNAGLGNQFGTTTLTHAGDGSNRLFLTWGEGVIRVITNRDTTPQTSDFLDISDRVDSSTGEGGLLGLAFDPAFRTNGYFYVYYVHCPRASCPNDGQLTVRISRFRDSSRGANSASPASETILREITHPARSHYAGWLGFGPDGMLYISRGDAEDRSTPQDPNKLFGKILRVRVNNSANRLEVPSDNPSFGGSAPNEVWALGFRNPFRCSFDRGTGDLWCGDVGQSDREEVNRVRKGGNYGWPVYEGELSTLNPNNRPYTDFDPPVYMYDHGAGVAVIGGYVYRGQALPGLVGRYVFGDYVSSNVWAIGADGSGGVAAVMPNALTIQAIGEDEAGELYATPPSGPIVRFEADGATTAETPMPSTLSATGLFTDTSALTPASGLIDYTVNAPFWSNGAQKQRWFRLPGTQTIGFSANGNWTFPVGTITVKHFELNGTRVETRVMVHRSDGWRGYTYRWRSDGQDADLVGDGGASATVAGQTWNFPSRGQCLQCHTAVTGRALGLNTRQFNGNHTSAATGRSDNQLRTLNHIGIFGSDIGAASQYGAVPNPTDASASIESRAKAYLDTNCSICHQPGGPTPVDMDLRYATSLSDMNIVGVATSQSAGTRIAAGNPGSSDLWQRVQSSDANRRMPPLGVQVVDQEAVQLLSTWITGLP